MSTSLYLKKTNKQKNEIKKMFHLFLFESIISFQFQLFRLFSPFISRVILRVGNRDLFILF